MNNREAIINRVNYIFDQLGDDANIYIGTHLYRDVTELSVMKIALMDVVTISDESGRSGDVVKHRWMQPTHKIDLQQKYA